MRIIRSLINTKTHIWFYYGLQSTSSCINVFKRQKRSNIFYEYVIESEPHLSETDSDGDEVGETVRKTFRQVINDSFKTLNVFLNTNENAKHNHYRALHKL